MSYVCEVLTYTFIVRTVDLPFSGERFYRGSFTNGSLYFHKFTLINCYTGGLTTKHTDLQ